MSQPLDSLSPEDEMMEAFRVFDTDGDGYITKARSPARRVPHGA